MKVSKTGKTVRVGVAVLGVLFFLLSCRKVATEAVSEIRSSGTEVEDKWFVDKNGKQKTTQFCQESPGFSHQNAYWLGALSRAAYLNMSVVKETFLSTGNPKTPSYLSFDKIHFFSSQPPEIGDRRAPDDLTLAITPPLPPTACLPPNWRSKEHGGLNLRQFCYGQIGYGASNGPLSQATLKNCGPLQSEKIPVLDNFAMHVNAVRTPKQLSLIKSFWKDCVETKSGKPKCTNKLRVEDYTTFNMAIDGYVKRHNEGKSESERSKIAKKIVGIESKEFVRACEYYQRKSAFPRDTQVTWFENKDMIVIAYRGTEVDSMKDIASDADLWYENRKNGKFSYLVHEGFNEAVLETKSWVIDNFRESVKDSGANGSTETKPVFVTGHSLGGALATLATEAILEFNESLPSTNATLSQRGQPKLLRINLKALYTYGGPRVGEAKFADEIDRLAANKKHPVGIYRYVNFDDPVPRAPCGSLLKTAYKHPGHLIHARYAQDPYKIEDILPDIFIDPVGGLRKVKYSVFSGKLCPYGEAIGALFHKNLLKAGGYHVMGNYYVPLEKNRNLENKCPTKLLP